MCKILAPLSSFGLLALITFGGIPGLASAATHEAAAVSTRAHAGVLIVTPLPTATALRVRVTGGRFRPGALVAVHTTWTGIPRRGVRVRYTLYRWTQTTRALADGMLNTTVVIPVLPRAYASYRVSANANSVAATRAVTPQRAMPRRVAAFTFTAIPMAATLTVEVRGAGFRPNALVPVRTSWTGVPRRGVRVRYTRYQWIRTVRTSALGTLNTTVVIPVSPRAYASYRVQVTT